MLIETDPVDWKKPIVFFDHARGKAFPAALVSTNAKSSSLIYYMVVIYQDEGDMCKHVTKDAKIAGTSTRCFFNVAEPQKVDYPEMVAEITKNVERLGEF